MCKRRVISFYLPQYYPTVENDEWWAKGFTEWTNVGRAKALFKGHYQPKVPTDLGYYDLRLPEVREEQAKLAMEAGIEGFCYWHYWFNGKRLLDRVFTEVVEGGEPDFPFCLCWANHSWYKKNWDPTKPNLMLMEQTYPGKEDYINHFNALLKAFKDDRYIKVHGKPVFGIYAPHHIPDFNVLKETWNELAVANGLPGIYFWGFTYEEVYLKGIQKSGMDAVVFDYMLATFRADKEGFISKLMHKIRQKLGRANTIEYKRYADLMKKLIIKDPKIHPCIIPNFDHSPRSGNKNIIIHNAEPKYFGQLCKYVFEMYDDREPEENLFFIKAWNEWGEGNYMEPDIKYGKGYIEELFKAVNS